MQRGLETITHGYITSRRYVTIFPNLCKIFCMCHFKSLLAFRLLDTLLQKFAILVLLNYFLLIVVSSYC